MNKILLLGAGRVGQAIVCDLAPDFDLTVADCDEKALKKLTQKYGVKTIRSDLKNAKTLTDLVFDFSIIIGAVPGNMGFATAQTVLRAGKDYVDISFFEEDAFRLKALAEERGCMMITDAGVAPGLDNLLLGYHNAQMKVLKFTCFVGGLPRHPKPPFNYKAPFSPIDVIAEYTRPARLVEGGKIIEQAALTGSELFIMKKRITLEAFLTDGLRTLLYTMPHIPDMVEKTLRYPGHRELMECYRKAGFFSEETIDVNGSMVRPLDVSTQLFFPMWQYEENEEEFTVMQVVIEGIESGKTIRYTYDIFDRFDPESGLSSMTRTTGYTCAAMVRMLAIGMFRQAGIYPLELLGEKENITAFTLDILKKKGIEIELTREELP